MTATTSGTPAATDCEWRRHTTVACRVRTIHDGHWLLDSEEAELTAALADAVTVADVTAASPLLAHHPHLEA